MRVLVACEESQAVTIELRKLGHEAYSCDIIPCSGDHPEWHIMQDVIPLINGNCEFNTTDGQHHKIDGKWDLLVAHPPCTFLTVTGNRWFNVERYGDKARQRMVDRDDAIKFFMSFANADCDRIAIENPVGIMSTEWRKPDCIVQPYEFGDPFEKKTCFWLKGLQPLKPTNVVEPPKRKEFASGKTMPAWYADAFRLPKEERAKLRSKTFPGLAKAIAEQWGGRNQKTFKVLELFSGTECVSNEFRKRGHDCFTVDWNEEFPSSLHCDISKLKASDIVEKFGKPDVIFAAFDCTTFSMAGISHHRRRNPDNGNLDPISEYARFCDETDQHVLDIIRELDPKVFIIENPRGGLRSMIWMKDIPRYTTTYCQYGFPYMKPTDFFSNVDLKLKPPCKNGSPCHEKAPRGSRHGLQGVKGTVLRSIYPPELVSHFVDVCEEVIK